MKAKETSLLRLLQKSRQFVIPIYQRTYSWKERECRQLWNDIMRAGKSDSITAHFVGSIVYIQKGLFQVDEWVPLMVIDGQQRLTTVTLILEALARHLAETGRELAGTSPKKLRHYYLLNPLEEGDQAFKLLLTQTDKRSLLALLQQQAEPAKSSVRVQENFGLFQDLLNELGDGVIQLWKGLQKLIVVNVALDRSQDNPQLIFESMNSMGRELSQADLIRNYVLMGLEPRQQKSLYDDHWRPMEILFGQEAYGTEFDWFMRHYLTLKTGDIPKIRSVYEAFKGHARSDTVLEAGVAKLVADIHTFAGYYCAMALGQEPDKRLGAAFRDLQELKVAVAFPFLLELYHDRAQGVLADSELLEAVRMLEAYVFRRAVCAIPTNSLNKTFATFGRALEKERYLRSMKAHYLTMPSYRRFPDDEEFGRELSRRDLYNFPRRSYWLRRLENHGRKEFVPVDEYTIEHILPQNEDLAQEWRAALGPEWRDVQARWVHTLGNLTLTGYNSEYSDHSFARKRDMCGGFRESPLRLNESLGLLGKWDEGEIQRRAKRLAAKAVRVWSRPALSEAELGSFGRTTERMAGYTVADHVHLVSGGRSRRLFDALREELLDLNPCVYEEILKVYVAFKAETNFVDVVPLKNSLRLTLNMRYHELHDPRGMARDVTNIGRWGNGDVEVPLKRPKELPYVMGLARQAFERQMGDGQSEA